MKEVRRKKNAIFTFKLHLYVGSGAPVVSERLEKENSLSHHFLPPLKKIK